ncbi:S8 family serine peptidase [Microcoleus sp. D3_18cC1]|uniref:S8 family serine peptidase n=1 Tax=Microcoleus sp. D3_18cC1 TaxID=3055336 RepID=UPI002FD1C80E
MAELNIGALADGKTYTGSVGATNIYDLYKFNITSPGSFQFSIDGLSGNADVFLLNSSGETLYSSTNAGTSAETISVDSLLAGDYSVKVLQISGDIKYTLNLAPTSTQKSSDADTLTGAKSDSLLPSNSAATSEKPTANKDVITGTPVDEKTVTAETTSTTTDKPVTTDSETTLTSEPEKPVATTESAAETTSTTTDKPVTTDSETTLTSEPEPPIATTESAAETTSTTTDKPVTTDSETTLTSEPEKPVATTESATEKRPIEETTSPPDKPPTDSAISTAEKPSETVATNNLNSTTATKTDAVAGETVATQEPKTGETLVTISPDASKPEDETNTDTSNGEETEKENSTTTVATTETQKEPEPTTDKKLICPFTSGVFTTDETGRISVDYTFDGGRFQGELAIFSLDDLEKFEPGSEAFIKEVAARSLSNSVKGHVVINDATEGARFSGFLGENNANEGVYLGVKSFAVTAGGKYGVMLVPNGSVKSVYDNPTVGGSQRPLFSMAMANPVAGFHFGQIADLTGEGNTFVMEDMRLDSGTDRDYNDIIFQVRGATATTALVDSVINPDKEWRKTDLGKALIAYAKPYITPEPKPNVDAELSDLLDDLEKEILNPSTSDIETPKTPAPATTTDKDTTDATQVQTTDQVDAKPTTPAVTTEEEVKDTANNSGDSTQVETTDKVDAKPTTPAVTTEEEVKDIANNSGDLTQVETAEKVEAKPTTPAVTTEEEVKDIANNSGDSTQVETTDKVDAKPTTPAVTTEEKVKDIANSSGDSTQVETTEKVDGNPTTGATTTPTAGKDTVADSTEKLPVEKTPIPAATTEVKDKVTEAPAMPTLPAKSTTETEVAATIQTEKVETKPSVLPAETLTKVETKPSVLPAKTLTKVETKSEVLPAETLTKVETKSEVLPAETLTKVETKPEVLPAKTLTQVETQPSVLPAETLTKVETKPEVLPAETQAKVETKPALVTEVEKTETPQVVVAANPVESVKESQPTVAIEPKETPAIVPPTAAKTMPVVGTNTAVDLRNKEIVTQTETAGVNDAAPKELLPISPTVAKPIENNSTAAVTEPVKQEVAQNNNNVNADWIARLDSIKQRLSNLGSADIVEESIIDRTLIARLETMTEKLRVQTGSTPISDNTAALISRLEDMVVKVAPKPVEPVQPVQLEFPVANQPLVGVIDTGFSGNNPDIDYSRIILGRDRVSNDANPLLATGEGNEHGTHILGIIGATQNNGVGIDGVNDQAPLWVGRAIGSGQWAESLVEFVNTAIESNQPNAVVNLSLDLTQINPDGNVTTRYEFTPEERSAIEYARQHNVLLVVAAGNDGGVMSVLGQASQEFDNIITVGAAERINDEIALSKAYDRADYSSYGRGLDIMADGGTVENPVLSTTGDGVGTMAGTSVATAKVTGAVSQVWAANPQLSYRQVIDILKSTATDLKEPNWDGETGAGLLNMAAALALAGVTTGEVYQPTAFLKPTTWGGEGKVTPVERAVNITNENFSAWVVSSNGITLRNSPNTSDRSNFVVKTGDTLTFDGWTYGEQLSDLTTGEADALWYRFRYNGGTYWVPSAWTGGYPGSQPPLLPPAQAPAQQYQQPPVSQQPTNNTVYLSTNAGEILQVDESTGASHKIYQGRAFTDLAVAPNGKLYGCTFYDGLYEINPSTGAERYVGPLAGGTLNSLTFSPDGRLYGADQGNGNLFQISPDNGQMNLIGNLGGPSSGDLVFNGANEIFATVSSPNTSLNDRLVAVNLATGNSRYIGDLGLLEVYGLSWENGQLTAYTSDRRKIAIDVNTGATSAIGNVSSQGLIWGAGDIPESLPSATDNVRQMFSDAARQYPQVGNAITGVQDQGGGVFRQEFERAIMIWNGQQVTVYETKGRSASPTSPSSTPEPVVSGKGNTIRTGAQGKDSVWWDLQSGDSNLFYKGSTPPKKPIEGDNWDDALSGITRDDEIKAVYDRLSTAVSKSVKKSESGYVYDQFYHDNIYIGLTNGWYHSGIDISVSSGEKVGSATNGQVLYVSKKDEFGEDTGIGVAVQETLIGSDSIGLFTTARTNRIWWYFHLENIGVQTGDVVKKGDPVLGTPIQAQNHLHITVTEITNPFAYPKLKGSQFLNDIEQSVKDALPNAKNQDVILNRTMSPLEAYWRYENNLGYDNGTISGKGNAIP